MRFNTLPCCSASWTNSTSPGLSSTNRISAGLLCTLISHFILLGFRDCESERRSSSGLRFHPEFSPVPLDHFLAYREPNPRARVLRSGVQALKHLENAFDMPRVDSDAVILHRNRPLGAAVHGGDMDAGALILSP